jgi:hypothetical protein
VLPKFIHRIALLPSVGGLQWLRQKPCHAQNLPDSVRLVASFQRQRSGVAMSAIICTSWYTQFDVDESFKSQKVTIVFFRAQGQSTPGYLCVFTKSSTLEYSVSAAS